MSRFQVSHKVTIIRTFRRTICIYINIYLSEVDLTRMNSRRKMKIYTGQTLEYWLAVHLQLLVQLFHIWASHSFCFSHPSDCIDHSDAIWATFRLCLSTLVSPQVQPASDISRFDNIIMAAINFSAFKINFTLFVPLLEFSWHNQHHSTPFH